MDDPFSTTLVYSYRVEDTLDISGYMVRQEQVLTGESGGLMRLQKNEGERVSTGGVIASVYADQASLDRQNEMETLNDRIAQLEYAQETMRGAEVTLKLDNQISRTLLDYRAALAAGRLDAAGASLPCFEAGLHLFRHRGPQRTDQRVEDAVTDSSKAGGKLRKNH